VGSLAVDDRFADLADFFVFAFDVDDLAVADLRAAMRYPRSCFGANIFIILARLSV
jgi:hypothetical protein